MAPLNRHKALESGGHVLFDVVDRTHQDDFTELTVPFTRSDGEPSERLTEEFTVSVIER
jgi:hypothetical protein